MLSQLLVSIIRVRGLVYTLAAAWLIFGIYAVRRLPIDALPNLSENQVLVYVRWPEKSPIEIYGGVTKPLAESLMQVSGLKTIRGSSDQGYGLLYLIFDDGVSLPQARQRIDEILALSQPQLPSEASIQVAPAGLATGQIVWYCLQGFNTDLVEVRHFQEKIVAPRLAALRGVAEVASVGGFTPEIEANVSAKALLDSRISLTSYSEQLSELVSADLGLKSVLSADTMDTHQLVVALEHLESQKINGHDGTQIPLGQLGELAIKPAPRFGSYEQDGTEAVAGIVHMTAGENTVEVTKRVLNELVAIQNELPVGWTCLPTYDRLSLIGGAVSTVTRTLVEAFAVTTLCIIIIMRHWRTSFVITLTLPLAVLGSAIGIYWLSGYDSNLNANIMSLAGVAVSIGILVDATVVIVENVTHRLKQRFRSSPVTGDTTQLVADATAQVAMPAIMSVVLMIVSVLPLFALGGLDGQMMRPLVWSKTLTLLSVIVLAITLVPCLATDLIRGHLRSEYQSRVLRSIINVYKPLISGVCEQPFAVLWVLCCLAIVAASATAVDWLVRCSIACAVVVALFLPRRFWVAAVLATASVVIGLVCQTTITPIQTAMRIPLDEGMIMDMPISRPGIRLQQATDDLKARNMILCRFPEVSMAMGKAGRGETAFDPAPIEMIETMIEFRDMEVWPSRRLAASDASRMVEALLQRLVQSKLIEPAVEPAGLVSQVVESGMPRFEAIQREVCWQLTQTFETKLGQEFASEVLGKLTEKQLSSKRRPSAASSRKLRVMPHALQLHLARHPDVNSVNAAVTHFRDMDVKADSADVAQPLSLSEMETLAKRFQHEQQRRWVLWLEQLNAQLQRRAVMVWTHIGTDEILRRQVIIDPKLVEKRSQILQARFIGNLSDTAHHGGEHTAIPGSSKLPMIIPHRSYDQSLQETIDQFRGQVRLQAHNRETLTVAGGELDRAVQMPGWINVWTRPIQNRIDMLTTGVNSEIGIRVMGDDLNTVVSSSEHIAEIVKQIPGAAGVLADPIRGKDEIEFRYLPSQANGRSPELAKMVLAATVGYRLPTLIPTSIKLKQPKAIDSDPVLSTELPLIAHANKADRTTASDVPLLLSQVGNLEHHDSAATIKSTDGRMSNYVRLNVVGRSAIDWVESAKEELAKHHWPAGVEIQWTGQYEHALRTRSMLAWLVPVCSAIILFGIWLTFRDLADTFIILLTLPGALIGATIAQWLLGLPISLSVIVGYISCLGMAAATGMVMLTYLRSSLEQAGGLGSIRSEFELKLAVIRGAAHRLRPKLLTEVTMIASLVPIMWSTGVGSDVIRPMAAPVLGGILIADEVIDLVVPALFYMIRMRRWRQMQEPKSEQVVSDEG